VQRCHRLEEHRLVMPVSVVSRCSLSCYCCVYVSICLVCLLCCMRVATASNCCICRTPDGFAICHFAPLRLIPPQPLPFATAPPQRRYTSASGDFRCVGAACAHDCISLHLHCPIAAHHSHSRPLTYAPTN
jgi:hypothetical protein